MKALSGKELARVLERHGWKLLRVRGSHHVFGRSGRQRPLVIPIHGNRSLSVGMIRDLMKEAGLSEEDFA
jgi:predicted RNA binding protein YcfA (HicA-like mRNA interferase family)